MKNQPITLLLLTLLVLISCKQPPSEEIEVVDEIVETIEAEGPDYAAFDDKVAIVRSFIKLHSEENLEQLTELFSDTLKYSPPQYNGNKWLGKEDLLSGLKNYHTNYENIAFTEGIVLADTLANGMWSGSVYPEANASSSPDAIRVYGTWTATHTESQKSVGVKWFGLMWANEDGKIVMFTDYFDVHGLAAQLAEE